MKGLTLLDLMIALLILAVIGFGILTFKSCTDRISNNQHIEYCERG